MRKNHRVSVWAVGLGLLAASAAFAAGRDVALGSSGEIYAVRTGTYGDLFPNGHDFDPANPVVALDITKPKSPAQRVLVPGTGGAEVESTPSVLFEDDSQTVFLLWETQFNLHPILQLAGFDGSGWSKPIEVIGNPFAPKTAFQFAITRDAYDEPAPGGSTVTRHRTVLHLLWQEETATGDWATLYSPLVINDGEYAGWNPIYDLDEYLQGRVTPSTADVQSTLGHAPILQMGRDERTLLIAYASTAMGRLAAVEIDVLPEALTRLADDTQSYILGLGQRMYATNLPGMAEKARSHIVDLGHAFRPEVVQAMADQVKTQILAGGADGLTATAAKARSHIVDLGAQFSGRGLRGVHDADATAKLVEIDPGPAPAGSSTAPESLLFQFRLVSNLPVPRIGAGDVRLLASESGANLIVSWAQADKIVYRSSSDSGWTDQRELRLADGFDLGKAYDALEQRLSNR
jgi:hypothetical protein